MLEFYRTVCSFTYRGEIRVEGRVHFELAESADDARLKSVQYLESCGYTDVSVTESRLETEEEKYGRPMLPSCEAEQEKAATKQEPPKQQASPAD